MRPVDGIDLSGLLEEVAGEMLTEKRRSLAGFIKALLRERQTALAKLDQLGKDMTKAQSHLEALNVKISRLRAADWSLLPETQTPPGKAEEGPAPQ